MLKMHRNLAKQRVQKERNRQRAENWTIDKIVVTTISDETKKCKQITGFCNKQKKKQSSRYRLWNLFENSELWLLVLKDEKWL